MSDIDAHDRVFHEWNRRAGDEFFALLLTADAIVTWLLVTRDKGLSLHGSVALQVGQVALVAFIATSTILFCTFVLTPVVRAMRNLIRAFTPTSGGPG